MAEECERRWLKFQGVRAQFLWICPAFKVLKSPASATHFSECFLLISNQTHLIQLLSNTICHFQTLFRLFFKFFQTCKFLSVCSKCQPSPNFLHSWLRRIILASKNYFKFQKNDLCPVCGLDKVSGQLFILPPLVPTFQFMMEIWTKECSQNGYSEPGHTTL